jgi:F-type H+-transporting ATPase subunit gamma
MANLKEIRTRIKSVKSTQQVTSAMKMVSAAKLRKAQEAILQMRPYANKLHEVLVHISDNPDMVEENPYVQNREENKILLIVVTSNRGLCGGFNSNVIRRTVLLIEEKYKTQYQKGNVEICAIGKKATDLLKSKNIKVTEEKHSLFDKLKYSEIAPTAESIMKKFADKYYDKVVFIYNQFKNAASQNLLVEQFLPIQLGAEKGSHQNMNYLFEPTPEYLAEFLIPKSLKIQFYKVLLDSNASEHGARMTAMHQATDNAGELIKSLKLSYNKARQASITKEILEIVGGANALKNA